MTDSSKDLLHLESKNLASSTIEFKLLVCEDNNLQRPQTTKPKPLEGVSLTSCVPKSQVMGKVKDFLGVISEANKRLDENEKVNVKDYDIEVLTGNESEYIEMDLMLGVADLHTPEAIAAAESAIAGHQPVISLASNQSETKSEDSDDDSSDDDGNDLTNYKRSALSDNQVLGKPSDEHKSKKRPKIVELL